MNLETSVFYWAGSLETICGFKHGQEVAYEDRFKIAQDMIDLNLQVMFQPYTSASKVKCLAIWIDNKRFTQR